MRNPSVNVLASTLREVLKNNGIPINDEVFLKILKDLKKQTCNWRSIQMNDKQIQRLSNPTLENKVSNLLKFNANLKNIKIPAFKRGSPNWWVIEKLSNIVLDLLELFKFEKSEEAIINELFSEILIRGIVSKDLPTKAFSYYEKFVILEDLNSYEHKEVVYLLQSIYLDAVKSLKNKTLEDAAKDILPFIKMVQDIVSYNADPADWIQAQFDAFSVFEVIPKPNAMYGEKAYERYVSYKSCKNE